MKKIHIEFSDERLITPSGLVFVGQILGKSSFVKKINRAPISKDYLQKQIKNGDVLLTYIGMLCQGKPQYEAVRDFLGWASPRMDNLLFAAHDNFWMDYLKGDLDVDAFKDFLVGTNNGIPNYGIGDEENMYIDETKLQWTKYMNPLGAHFGTPEELFPIPEL